MSDDRDQLIVKEAASISCGTCDFCPAVHVNLINENGEVFATASVPIENCEPFITNFRRCMSELTSPRTTARRQ